MKFTDGYWLLREGVTAAYPAEVLDVVESDGTLEMHAPTRPIRSRGDLMTGPVLTVNAHTPMPDVIGLTLTHLTGGRPQGPAFGISASETAPQLSYDDEHATLTSGDLT
ncbi:alpha-xylosidase, partial [Streptomyces sp. NPDC006386]